MTPLPFMAAALVGVSSSIPPGFPLVSPEAASYIAHVERTRRIIDMIELVQFPWSPFCIVQRRILEFAEVRFKIINIANGDRSLVWRLSKERYYAVPIIKDGKTVVFEVSEDSQVIAKYLDSKLQLGLSASLSKRQENYFPDISRPHLEI